MPNLKISQFTNLASGSQGTSLVIPLAQTDTANFKMTLDALFSDIAYNTADRGIGMIGVATASAPSVSAAGKSKTYYDTTLNKQMLSREGAAYQQIIVGSPSFPLSVSNSTGQITSTTSDTGAAVTNPGLVVTRGDSKRTAQLWITNDATPEPQLLLSAEIIASDPICSIAFNKRASGGGAAPATASLGAILFQSNGNTSANFEVVSLGGTIGNTATFYSTRSGTFSNAGIFGVDNWGTFRVSRNLGPAYSDVQLSDPSKLMVIGNVDSVNDTTKVCLHIRNATGFTDQTNLLLQAVSGQTTNLFECKTNANVKTLQITAAGVLSPGVAAQVDLGTSALPFKDLYLAGSSGTPATNNYRITGTATAARVITLPDATCTLTASASALTSGRVPFVTTGGLLTDSANWTYTTGSSPNFLLQAANAAHVAAVFRGAASQTANVLECQNSSGTVFLSVASDGSIAQTVTKSGASTTLGTSVAVNFQNTGGFNRAAIFVGTSNPSSASTAAVIGFEARADLAGNATVFTSGSLIGVSAQIRINSGTASGTLPSGFGVRSIVDNQNSSVTLTNGYGYWASTPTRTGAITNYFAFYTEALTSADYAFYSAGTGRVYIGDTTNSTSAGTGALLLNGGIGLADAKDISFGTTTGTKIGTSTSQKIGFFNATPIVQPASANQAALTDSTTGTPSTTLVDAGAAYSQANINNNFASVARLLNQLRSDLVSLGLIKGAA